MIRPIIALFATLAVLTGCSTSPTPSLYVLQPVSGTAITTRPMAVELRRLSLAGYLDRPEMVRGPRDYRLSVDSESRWAEPLGAMAERVLTEDLVTRLHNASVFSESGAISTRPDLVIELDVQRLDTDSENHVVLLAQLALRPEDGVARAVTLRLRQDVRGPSASDHAAAVSATLGSLADEVAQRIATFCIAKCG